MLMNLQRQSLECSPNPTHEWTIGNGGNIRVLLQGSFFVVSHKTNNFIWSRVGAQESWYYPGVKNPCNEHNSHYFELKNVSIWAIIFDLNVLKFVYLN